MIRIPYLAEALGILLIGALAFGAVQTIRLKNAELFHKDFVAEIKDEMIELYKANTLERNRVEAISAEIGREYSRGVENGKKLNESVVADLRADNSELRSHWGSALRRADAAEAALATSDPDGTTDSVSADLAAFVQNAAEGDAKIMSLQQQVNLYLCQINKEPFPGYKCPKL